MCMGVLWADGPMVSRTGSLDLWTVASQGFSEAPGGKVRPSD